ncbi:hypothetical protein H3V53_36575 [Paraburkholderia bengalensis]|uniref:Uncharacterized protein n=1 Tax=Paraburkholderia bengalensis TaxID=2747562 RepID=A0ABU8J3Q2_9BURK
MKTDLAELIDAISTANGRISINDLSASEIDSLRDKIVWAYSDQRAPGRLSVRRAGLSPEGNSEGTGDCDWESAIRL